jgi:hypothetical protein
MRKARGDEMNSINCEVRAGRYRLSCVLCLLLTVSATYGQAYLSNAALRDSPFGSGVTDSRTALSIPNDDKNPHIVSIQGAGTTPPEMQAPGMESGGAVVIRWASYTNHLYTVHHSTNLLLGFTVLQGNILGTPPMNSYTDTLNGVQVKFWRVTTAETTTGGQDKEAPILGIRVTTEDATISGHKEGDLILGVWHCPIIIGGTIEIKPDEGKYLIYQVATDSNISDPGELIGEIVYVASKKQYIGRHIWGGKRNGPSKWGREGGLEIGMQNPNKLFQVYLDSRYTGGWVFTRVDH